MLIVFIVQTLARRKEGPDWHDLVEPGSRPNLNVKVASSSRE